MIITAEVARKKVDETLKQRRKFLNSIIREIRDVELEVNRQSMKGKTFAMCHRLKPETCEILKNNGYRTENRETLDYEWTVIFWNETN